MSKIWAAFRDALCEEIKADVWGTILLGVLFVAIVAGLTLLIVGLAMKA